MKDTESWEQGKAVEQDILMARAALDGYYQAPLTALRVEKQLRRKYPFLEEKEWGIDPCWSPFSEPEILVRLRWEIKSLGRMDRRKSA